MIIDVDRTALDPLELVLNVRDLDARVPILLFGMHGDPLNRQVLRRQGQPDFVTSQDAARLVRRYGGLGGMLNSHAVHHAGATTGSNSEQ